MKYRLFFPPLDTIVKVHKLLPYWDGVKPKDMGIYEPVFEGDVSGPGFDLFDNPVAHILEYVFKRHNVGDYEDGEKPEGGKHLRSMSVGDIVEINGEFWMVDSSGYKQLHGTDIPQVKI